MWYSDPCVDDDELEIIFVKIGAANVTLVELRLAPWMYWCNLNEYKSDKH